MLPAASPNTSIVARVGFNPISIGVGFNPGPKIVGNVMCITMFALSCLASSYLVFAGLVSFCFILPWIATACHISSSSSFLTCLALFYWMFACLRAVRHARQSCEQKAAYCKRGCQSGFDKMQKVVPIGFRTNVCTVFASMSSCLLIWSYRTM